MLLLAKFVMLSLIGMIIGAAGQQRCQTQEGAVALFAAACEQDLACRFEIVDNARIGAGQPWADIYRARIQDILTGTESRAFFEPPAWTAQPLVVVSPSDGADCAALATSTAAPPPLEILHAVDTLVKYQNYVSEDSRCSDLNTVAVPTMNGTWTCQCLPDKICQASGEQRRDKIHTITLVILLVVLIGQFAGAIGLNAMRLRQAAAAAATASDVERSETELLVK